MRGQIEQKCPQHQSPWDCPEAVVIYSASTGIYGLPVRDGEFASASSYITIQFCPWCGQRLPDEIDSARE
jgi:hypothetical protein